jgi:hypothetical protein
MAEEAKEKLTTGNYIDALPLLNRATLYAVQLLDRADPFFVQLKSEVTGWFNSRAFPIAEEGNVPTQLLPPRSSPCTMATDVLRLCRVRARARVRVCRVCVCACVKATTDSTRPWVHCWHRRSR